MIKSWLFAPGDSEKKIVKAQSCGAGAVILDLEDSVALSAKQTAREIVAAALAKPRAVKLYVRVNPLDSGLTLADLAAVTPAAPDGIVLPKPNSGADVLTVAHYLDAFEAAANLPAQSLKILPIATETPHAIFNLGTYAHPRLSGLTWGAEDLPAAAGARSGRNPDGTLSDLCRLARALCIAGAAAAGVPAIDTVYPDFRDTEGFRATLTQGRRNGFKGALAIHPSQVAIINEVMTPSAAELEHAQKVVHLFAANPGAGVIALEGKMLDLPHLKLARALLRE